MQANKFSDFDSFMEDVALNVLNVAPGMEEFCLDFRVIEDMEAVVLLCIDPREKILEFDAVRPEGLWANFKFPYGDLSADESRAYELYLEIGNALYDFFSDEEEIARQYGAADLDTESRLKVVANINDLCEGMEEIDGDMNSFSFVKELDAYVYMLYIFEAKTMLAIAMNTNYQTASLGVRLKEQLAHMDPTMLGFKIVGELEKGLNAAEQ